MNATILYKRPFWVPALVFLWPTAAKAISIIAYVIALTIVAGAIVGSIWYLQHYVLPPEPPQNQMQQAVNQYGPVGGNITVDFVGIGYDQAWTGFEIGLNSLVVTQDTTNAIAGSVTNVNDNGISSDDAFSATNGFTIQYGIALTMTNGASYQSYPWTAVNDNVPASVAPVLQPLPRGFEYAPQDVLIEDTNAGVYAFSFSIDGETYIDYSTNINDYNGEGEYEGTDYTNVIGPQTVVIQRTFSLTNPTWVPIFTNAIGMNTVETFTDTNPAPWISVTNYAGNGSTTNINPGSGGSYGTNLFITSYSTAFYRLAWQTNSE